MKIRSNFFLVVTYYRIHLYSLGDKLDIQRWLLKAFFPVQISSQMWHFITSSPQQALCNLNFSEVGNYFPQISHTKPILSGTIVVMRLNMLNKTLNYEKIMKERENILRENVDHCKFFCSLYGYPICFKLVESIS